MVPTASLLGRRLSPRNMLGVVPVRLACRCQLGHSGLVDDCICTGHVVCRLHLQGGRTSARELNMWHCEKGQGQQVLI